MTEWLLLLLSCLLILLLLALVLALYPLHRSLPRGTSFLFALILILFVGLAYWHWGSGSAWRHYVQNQVKRRQVDEALKTMHDPSVLIASLKATLVKKPKSAKGWYLLGRLYASQQQWQLAQDAFTVAHQLKPQDIRIMVNYAQNLWQLNNQQFDDAVRDVFETVLKQDPNQPDALAMLALDAYNQHQFQRAIDYWQQLLKLAPKQSADAQSIRKAIAKAQQMMVN